jgi:3-hydroxybutyryl-CoA dehydrogenase
MAIQTVGVTGAGTMGAGIAQVFAQSGFAVKLYDSSSAQLEKARQSIEENLSAAVAKNKLTADQKSATLDNIEWVTSLETLTADLIIEAITEKPEAKQQLFQQLAAINSTDTILASNTSSISITQIAAGIPHAQRVAGLHFFNPAHLMKLVEITAGAETAPEVIEALKEACTRIGKTAVVCKDSPGFIVNRVARHYYVESLKILEENAASIANIDILLESAGFKMGPFKLMDTIGNDVNFAVTSSLYEAFHQEAKFRPSRIQQQKVQAGHLGKKTGKGFYDYSK